MSHKIEFGQKGEKRDFYQELLIAAMEARAIFDVLRKVRSQSADPVMAANLVSTLEKDLRERRDRIDDCLYHLGAGTYVLPKTRLVGARANTEDRGEDV